MNFNSTMQWQFCKSPADISHMKLITGFHQSMSLLDTMNQTFKYYVEEFHAVRSKIWIISKIIMQF
jgi:hypothetical protein